MQPAQPSLNQNDGEESVLFFGRTLTEYVNMFDLDLSSWKGSKVLDCAAGPASFVAEANKLGIHAIGCDPLYANDLELLINQGRFVLERTLSSCLVTLIVLAIIFTLRSMFGKNTLHWL